jgi:hypothetical protein
VDGSHGGLLFENAGWRVLASGLEHKATSYWIPREEFAFRRADGEWLWPAQLAEKSWCVPTETIEALRLAGLLYGHAELDPEAAWPSDSWPGGRHGFATLGETLSPWLDEGTEGLEAAGADGFARSVIRAICRAGVSARVGERLFAQCLRAVRQGGTAHIAFRHPAKAEAIDRIWAERERVYRGFLDAADPLAYLRRLPGIGPCLARRLAAEFGLDVAELREAARVAA